MALKKNSAVSKRKRAQKEKQEEQEDKTNLKKQKTSKKKQKKDAKKNDIPEKERTPSKYLVLNNIPRDTTQDEILEIFSDCGPLVNHWLGLSYGILRATLEFSSIEDAEMALEKHKNGKIRDVTYQLVYPLKLPNRAPYTKQEIQSDKILIMFNVPPFVTEENIKKIFSDCGDIVKIDLSSLLFRGYVIVEFSSSEGASTALEKKQGLHYQGYYLELQYKSKSQVGPSNRHRG